MYRKDSGSIGFSWQHFANNAGASFMFDSTKDPGHISVPQKDMVFDCQISRPEHDAKCFVPEIFSVSGILDNETISRKVYHSLQKSSVLSHDGRVDTRQIGPQFTHQLAVISVIRQKQIVDMLFWWEGECERMERIEEAKRKFEEDYERAKKEGDQAGVATAKGMIDEMERMRREKPSSRTDEPHLGSTAGAEGDQLPQYPATAGR